MKWLHQALQTGDEIIEALKEIYNEENLNKLKYRIIDWTNFTEYRVYSEEIEKIADLEDKASITNPNLMIAVNFYHLSLAWNDKYVAGIHEKWMF